MPALPLPVMLGMGGLAATSLASRLRGCTVMAIGTATNTIVATIPVGKRAVEHGRHP